MGRNFWQTLYFHPEPKTQNPEPIKGQGRGAGPFSGLAPIQQAEVQGGPPLVMRYPRAQGHVQGAGQWVVGGHINGAGLQDVAAAPGPKAPNWSTP